MNIGMTSLHYMNSSGILTQALPTTYQYPGTLTMEGFNFRIVNILVFFNEKESLEKLAVKDYLINFWVECDSYILAPECFVCKE